MCHMPFISICQRVSSDLFYRSMCRVSDHSLEILKNQENCCSEKSHTNTHTHTTILRPFFRDHPGEPVPEENFWTLWCKGRLTEANTLTIWLGATSSGLTSAHLHHSPIFYRPDTLPAAQPTVSKHWRQSKHWRHCSEKFLTVVRNQLWKIGKCM